MGFGGNLILTSVIRNIHLLTGQKIFLCYRPKLSDLFFLHLYRSDLSAKNDAVFKNNPRVVFNSVHHKSKLARFIDGKFDSLLVLFNAVQSYEHFLEWLAGFSKTKVLFLDSTLNSYASGETPERMIWKSGGHAVDIILRNFSLIAKDHQPEMYFDSEEESRATHLLERLGIKKPFVLFEPYSNAEWFLDLRSWPVDRWQKSLHSVQEKFNEKFQLIQMGVKGSLPLSESIPSIAGKIDFREAALLMRTSVAFIGQEGGLMHLAMALNTPSFIIWGGLTTAEFAGYPEKQKTLYRKVECAPCGLRIACPNGKKCLTQFSTQEVTSALFEFFQSTGVRMCYERKDG